MLKSIAFSMAAIAAVALPAAAQTTALQTTDTQTIHVAGPVAGVAAKGMTMAFRTQALMDAAPVKGSPFCATITSEHTQQFSDGNRIHTTEDSQLCRDSQGRTRREAQLELLGAVPQGAAPKIITIEDPVAGFRYTLDTFAKVARKMPLGPKAIFAEDAKAGVPKKDVIYSRIAAGPDGALPPLPPGGEAVFISKRVISNGAAEGALDPQSAKEDLGDQTINGIHATGTRITTTIPAGKMGNELPMNVVSENWYSPELKATVMTKHTDPWAGTLTTQFSNVNTAEPDPSLFTVPSDYKIVEEKAEPFVIRMRQPAATPQN